MHVNDKKPAEGWGEDPLQQITKRFIKLAQIFFGVMPKGGFHWDAIQKESEIFISDQKSVNQELLVARPALLFHRGNINTVDIAIRNIQSGDAVNSEHSFSDLMPGVMTVNCIAREGVVATRLAWTLFNFIRRFNNYFIIGTPIHDMGKHMSIGAESEPGALIAGDSQPNATLVVLSAPYSFQDSWKISDEDGIKLNSVKIMLEIQKQNLSTFETTVMLNQDVNVVESAEGDL